MKKNLIALSAAVAATFGLTGAAFAFHDGGVAYCDGCHTMHNSGGGATKTVNPLPAGTANAYLLQGQDQSSTCLKCHSGSTGGGYKVATNPVPGAGNPTAQFTPGGDFAWIQKSYTWTQPRSGSSPGDRHGHNIVAADFGYNADGTLATAPGGTYPKASLACSSCHDPHGKYRLKADGTFSTTGQPIHASGSYSAMPDATDAVGAYRLLAGNGYQPKSVTGSYGFTANPPIAVAPGTYNRSEQTADTRVAYGQGMSEWCGNCHSGFVKEGYTSGMAGLRHPAGNDSDLPDAIRANYNSYVKTGDLTGTVDTSYNSLVPFEEGTADRTILVSHATNDGSYTKGAEAGANVMCLSCHRAHATGFKAMTRWNAHAEFLTIEGAYADASLAYDVANEKTYRNYADGKSATELQAAYNDRLPTEFATFQRSMCNKCHAKD